jgi:hypothetical protein
MEMEPNAGGDEVEEDAAAEATELRPSKRRR